MPEPPLSDETLLAYAAGELDGAEAAAIARRLEHDEEAARRVALYRHAAATTQSDDTVAPPAETVARAKAVFKPVKAAMWPERIEAFVARLLFDSRQHAVAVRYADTADRFQLSYEVNDLEIDLTAERQPGGSQRWRLVGQLAGDGTLPEIEVAAVLAGHGTPAASARTDATALFQMELTPGTYDLRFRLDETVILVPNLRIT